MKKRELLLAVLLLCGAAVFGQKPGSIIDEVLKQSAFDKVERMRELVGFDEQQAQRLKTVEYTFLWEVRKAEGCFLCNRKKRIEKLRQRRHAQLQEILTREQYIRYDAVESDRIEKIAPRVAQ